jgi:hypothetical protein
MGVSFPETGIPSLEGLIQFLIQHLGSCLQEPVRTPLGPLHLLHLPRFFMLSMLCQQRVLPCPIHLEQAVNMATNSRYQQR